LAVVVHPSNPVTNLSTDDIRKIFTGTIKLWKNVGGADETISLYSREPNSGTYLYFEEHVLLGDSYSNDCTFTPGARALIDSVARDSAAVGYSTFAYANTVKLISVNGVQPTAENVRKGTYPISRYLYFYTTYPPDGAIKVFIDWVVSDEGQKIAKANGYVPLFDVE
jgi:phosphate transport system substrate-binding protein